MEITRGCSPNPEFLWVYSSPHKNPAASQLASLVLCETTVDRQCRCWIGWPGNGSHNMNLPGNQPELTFASDLTSSGFYQAFVTIDKFLKHSFESRILLEPAKLVKNADQLSERRTELQTFRAVFPTSQNSTLLIKKHGRFGREEATIDQFLESDKCKELPKLKSTMFRGQLTRQPSTRTKKATSQLENDKPSTSTGKNKHQSRGSPATTLDSGGGHKSKRAVSTGSPAIRKDDPDSTHHLDPFLRGDPLSSLGKVRKRIQ
ncbi:hypothetical protein PTTG_29623 [Puccinia triticina 1-1 BBBD Race 1]|uniref:Uncharacterized protein n=1 Tax=Puccinia triticina (isolate 1-1 / race 1 (BBBD)) TaxID=630390 RepID=A0A180G2T3_PUCT1|nr:hypothetical protein PTTG_29623 [Puccinia triticina 1-1 BBBD Race 1]